jgi:hypothetical protein
MHLRYINGQWEHKAFRGTRWQSIQDETRRLYLTNTYRVLLTRARQGFVIYVPKGDSQDHTRLPEYYDGIYLYLRSIGLEELD